MSAAAAMAASTAASTTASATAAAVGQLNAMLAGSHHVNPSMQPDSLAQSFLSSRLEEIDVAAMLDPAGGLDARARALLRLHREPGAGHQNAGTQIRLHDDETCGDCDDAERH